jgi:hypothetical protein
MRFQEVLRRQMSARFGAGSAGAGGERTGARLLRLFAALVLVNVLLLAPSWVLAGRIGAPWLAVEAGVVVAALMLLPAGRWTVGAALAAATAVLLVALVGLGDTALRLSLNRPVNVYLDFWLLASVRDLMVGTLGPAWTTVAIVSSLAAAAALTVVVAFLLAPVGGDRDVWTTRLSALAIVGFVGVGLAASRVPGLGGRVASPAVGLAVDQSRAFITMMGERERFADALARAPDSYAQTPGLLAKLGDRDVILGFIESYGMTALEDPRYAPVVGPRLDDFQERIAAAGLHLVSGALVAPTQGGQSWFSHGSLLSGLWLDNQIRYDMLLAAGRETLIDDFRRAGHRTVALMPAIIMPWPEGQRFGYDEIFVRKDIDYAGPSLNWVTMPDQFTWSFLERSIRDRARGPLFAELSLVSSHAPWTPILSVLDDWEGIGDGRVFDAWAGAGERPEELWLDTDRVREQFALSIEYAVHAMAAYAERYVDDRTLLIALGDHQPAPLITGDDAPWSVPVHVISGDSTLVAPFLAWGFVRGAWPDPAVEPVGMDYFRDWFVQTYSGS